MPSPGTGPGHRSLPGEHGSGGPGPQLRWRRVFPGHEAELRQVRRWLAGLLSEAPARDDAVLVATELATNAVKHTASGRGGFFAVEVTWHSRPPVLRVMVADGGAPKGPYLVADAGEFADHGRGLHLVCALASRTGVCGDHRGRLVWAELSWPAEFPALTAAGGYQDAIRDGEAALTRRFPSAPAWFGWSTLQWWALAGPGELITAPTAAELLRLLGRFAEPAPPPCRAATADAHAPQPAVLRPGPVGAQPGTLRESNHARLRRAAGPGRAYEPTRPPLASRRHGQEAPSVMTTITALAIRPEGAP